MRISRLDTNWTEGDGFFSPGHGSLEAEKRESPKSAIQSQTSDRMAINLFQWHTFFVDVRILLQDEDYQFIGILDAGRNHQWCPATSILAKLVTFTQARRRRPLLLYLDIRIKIPVLYQHLNDVDAIGRSGPVNWQTAIFILPVCSGIIRLNRERIHVRMGKTGLT